MASISFDLREREGGSVEVVPAIDSTPLTDLVHAYESGRGYVTDEERAYGGLVPSQYRFGPAADHYLGLSAPATDSPRAVKTPLLGCTCGEWGCWPLLARITASECGVTWSEFEQPFRPERDYAELGPFVFDRRAYEDALQVLQPIWPS